MPKLKVKKREARSRKPVTLSKISIPVVPDCLICWEPLTESKVPGRVTRFQSVFHKLCSILNVDLSNSTWDFSSEAFPFCPPCFKEIEALVRLQEKLIGIQKEIEDSIRKVKNQLSESDHKFVSTDLRIIQFRCQALGDPAVTTGVQNIRQGNHHSSSDFNYGFPHLTNNTNSNSGYHNPNTQTQTQVQASKPEFFDDFGLVEVQVDYDQINTDGNFSTEEDDDYEDRLGMVDDDNDEDYEPSHCMSPRRQHVSKRGHRNVTKGSSKLIKRSKTIASKKSYPRRTQRKARKSKETDHDHEERRKAHSREYFAPLKTTRDGKIFYENIEISKSDIGYVCGLCGWMCKVQGHSNVTLRKTKIHIKGAHLNAYKCEICNEQFSSNDILSSHIRTIHQTGKISCDICFKPISSRPGHMDAHRWTHKNAEEKAQGRALGLEPTPVLQYKKKQTNKRHKCHKCDKSFVKPSELAKHLSFHLTQEGNEHIKCPECNKLLYYDNSIREHMKTHPEKVTMKPEHSCPNCKKKYFFRTALDAHINRVHSSIEEKPFGCPICNKRFDLEKQLQYHTKNHKPIEYYTVQCSFCTLRLKNLQMLKIHRQMFHRDKIRTIQPIKIDINKIRTQTKLPVDETDSSARHRKRQSEYLIDGSLRINRERLEPFDDEPKDGKLYFKGYEVSKLEGGGFSCVTCGSKFDQNSNKKTRCRPEKAVKHHIILDHLGGYVCIYCDRKFPTQSVLTNHKHAMHFLVKTDCEVCGKEVDRKEYKPHLWTHKNQEDMVTAINLGENIPNYLKSLKTALHRKVEECVTFKCRNCQEAFSSVNALDDHRLKFHFESILEYRRNKATGQTEVLSRQKRRKQDSISNSSTISSSEEDEVNDNGPAQSPRRSIRTSTSKLTIRTTTKVDPVPESTYSTPTKPKQKDNDIFTNPLKIIRLSKKFNPLTQEQADEPIKCPECSKLLYYNSSVREHMRTHPQKVTIIPEHPCPNCNKKYFFRSALGVHMARIHCPIEEKTFACPICNQRFHLQNELKHHSKNHKPMEYYTVQCSFCTLRLKSSQMLKIHRQMFHRDKIRKRRPTIKIDVNKIRKLPDEETDSNARQSKYLIDGSLRINSEILEPFDDETDVGKLSFKGYEVFKLKGGGFSCVTCGSKFDQNPTKKTRCPEKAVKHHIILDHLGGYACNYCDRKFKTQSDLTNHKHAVHFRVKSDCEVCGKYLDRREYKGHLWTHKNQEDMVTAINLGENIPHYFKSLKTALPRKVEENITFKCGDCQEAFSSVNALDDHRLKCHLESILEYRKNKATGQTEMLSKSKCRKQDFNFNTNNDQDDNNDSGHVQSPRRRSIRTRQLKLTTRDRTKVQPEDHVSVSTESTPTMPKRKENDVIAYPSESIGPSRTVNNLTQEVNVSIKCQECNKVLYSNSSVREHIRTHTHPKVTIIPEHPCPNCSKKYFFRGALDVHMARVHCPIEDKPFGCPICNQRFDLENELQHHSMNHKPIEYYTVQCTFCTLRLKSLHMLKIHRQMFHWDKIRKRRPTIKIAINEIRTQTKFPVDETGSNARHRKMQSKYLIDGSLRINRERLEPFDDEPKDGKLYFKGYEVSKLKGGGFSCVTCGSKFDQNPTKKTRCRPEKAVKHHIILDHFGGYACNYCDRKFKTQTELTNHKHAIHFRVKTLCEVCGKELDRREYKGHLWTHKNQEDMVTAINLGENIPNYLKSLKTALPRKVEENITFKCGDCQEAFSSVNALDDHRLQCHLESILEYRKIKATRKTEVVSKTKRRKRDPSSSSSANSSSDTENDVDDNDSGPVQSPRRSTRISKSKLTVRSKTTPPEDPVSTSTPITPKRKANVGLKNPYVKIKIMSPKKVASMMSKEREDTATDTDTMSHSELDSSDFEIFANRPGVEMESSCDDSKFEFEIDPDPDSASDS